VAKRLLLAAAFVAASLSAARPTPAQEQGGPTALVITYRCAPANRPAFRESVLKNDLPRFERWKRAGALESYRLLFNWYVDEGTWDMMAVLSFRNYAGVARWREIERGSPGGLSQESLRLGAPTNTYSADLTWRGSSPRAGDSVKSVFFVIPYDVADMGEYKPYVAGYVIPQLEGWIREGVLNGYGMYLNRYYAGRPWDSLLILEYKDMESFGRRESVVAKVRAALAADAKWKALSDTKKNLRTEKESVLAEELTRR
jgi:hypothetical protein